DLTGHRNLTSFGSPVYTSDVSTGAAAGIGSSLAVLFGGTGQYFSNNLVSGATDNFGIEAWVKPNTVSSTLNLIAYNGNSTSNGWGIYQNRSNYFGVFGGVTSQIGATTPTASRGTWTHVALVRSAGVAGLFINGVLSGSTTNVAPHALAVGNGFAIG